MQSEAVCVCACVGLTKVTWRELVAFSGDSCSTCVCAKSLSGDGEERFVFLCGAVGQSQGFGVSAGNTKKQK